MLEEETLKSELVVQNSSCLVRKCLAQSGCCHNCFISIRISIFSFELASLGTGMKAR